MNYEYLNNKLLWTKQWCITTTQAVFSIMMPDKRYIMWTWDNEHKLIGKSIYKL